MGVFEKKSVSCSNYSTIFKGFYRNICYNMIMADYVLARKSRNIVSNIVYVLLNILLGFGVVLGTVFSGSPAIGILLVLLSKWRIFAVRRRYLFLNIKANLVDLIVGFSIVLLAYYTSTSLVLVDFILVGIYIIWLLIIKPMSSEKATLVQSIIAVLLGISASTIMTAGINAVASVILAFLIGYAASRHILIQSDSKDFTLTTLVCGLIFGEVAFLGSNWNIIYTFGDTGIRVPQVAIILTIFAFIYNYVRQTLISHQDDFRFKDIIGPIIFGIVLIGVIVLWFSDPIFNI